MRVGSVVGIREVVGVRLGKAGGVLLTVVAVLGAAVLVYLAGPDDPAPAGSPAPVAGVPGTAEPASVRSHVDGDTVHLTGRRGSALLPEEDTTVRLLEVDTPELAREGRPAECYAEEASEALSDLLPVGGAVWVDRDEELRDQYGRTLLYVWTADGDLVNLRLVRQGYGRAVLFEPNDAHIERMRRAEAEARAAGRGLWGACSR